MQIGYGRVPKMDGSESVDLRRDAGEPYAVTATDLMTRRGGLLFRWAGTRQSMVDCRPGIAGRE